MTRFLRVPAHGTLQILEVRLRWISVETTPLGGFSQYSLFMDHEIFGEDVDSVVTKLYGS